MQRRSLNRAPRKIYTEDAFAAVPELRDLDSPTGTTTTATPQRKDDDEDDFVLDETQPQSADELDGEGVNSNDEEPPGEVPSKPATTPKRRNRLPPTDSDGQELLSRGILDGMKFYVQAGKENKRQLYFGSSEIDQRTVYKGFSKWAHATVLPTHTAGFGRPFLNDDQAYSQALDQDWEWCCGPSIDLSQRQVVTRLSIDEVRLPTQARAFILGSVDTPKQYLLPPQASLPIRHAFDRPDRGGYIINAGARIRCVDWLPHADGTDQYLAIATTTLVPTYTATSAPAFTPEPATQTVLQIWRIDTTQQQQPSLKALLSTAFGEYKRFEFCRFPARTAGPTPRLLAGVFGDGSLRVIVFPDLTDTEVDIHHVSKALVSSTPPSTVYTCFSWMSPRRIVAGCANGAVALLDLSDAVSADNLRPRKYSSISLSYIIDIAACTPSCPSHFMTSSMDGQIRLTDSSQPNMASPGATVHTSRVRSILTSCVWHDYSRAGLLTDDTFAVRLHLIRRIFNLFTVARTTSTPTALAVSTCHPLILMGTAAGDVQSTNPTVKLIDSKSVVWQQIWFAHEWRRGREGDNAHITEHGLTKFSEGFLPERVNLARTQTPSDGTPGSVTTNTVYEKGSAITSLSWNSNLHAGGWAAAGMADALVRVEDIAIP